MGTRLTLKEIDNQLTKKDLNPQLVKSLNDKKNILTNDKVVKK